jgi:hypothetical protein
MVWLVKVVWNQPKSGTVDQCAPRQRRFAYVTVEGNEFVDVENAVRFHRRYRNADAVTVIGTWTEAVGVLADLAAVVSGVLRRCGWQERRSVREPPCAAWAQDGGGSPAPRRSIRLRASWVAAPAAVLSGGSRRTIERHLPRAGARVEAARARAPSARRAEPRPP